MRKRFCDPNFFLTVLLEKIDLLSDFENLILSGFLKTHETRPLGMYISCFYSIILVNVKVMKK